MKNRNPAIKPSPAYRVSSGELKFTLYNARSVINNMISIKKDMSPLEREERRYMVKIMNKKKAGSEERGQRAKCVIRNGKVINVERRVQEGE